MKASGQMTFTPEGIPFFIPNTTVSGDGFYVSYNTIDSRIYGDVTTALVDDDMRNFYILNGDHRKQYSALLNKGYAACLAYYKENIGQSNSYSDKLEL